MRTTVAEPLRTNSKTSTPASGNGVLAMLRGTLIVAGLVLFWIFMLVANLVSLPVRLIIRLLRL